MTLTQIHCKTHKGGDEKLQQMGIIGSFGSGSSDYRTTISSSYPLGLPFPSHTATDCLVRRWHPCLPKDLVYLVSLAQAEKVTHIHSCAFYSYLCHHQVSFATGGSATRLTVNHCSPSCTTGFPFSTRVSCSGLHCVSQPVGWRNASTGAA